LPAPTADEATALELRTIVSTAARALAAATGEHPGPVHLNLSFRDPLVPRPRTDDPAPLAETPAQRIVLTRRAGTGPAAPHPVPVDDRTVVVAGDGAGPEAAELAARHGLPLLAEPSSGARHGQTLVPGYPALLRARRLPPPAPARPVVAALRGAEDVEVIVVDPQLDWADVARRARLVVPAPSARSRGPSRRRSGRRICTPGARPPPRRRRRCPAAGSSAPRSPSGRPPARRTCWSSAPRAWCATSSSMQAPPPPGWSRTADGRGSTAPP